MFYCILLSMLFLLHFKHTFITYFNCIHLCIVDNFDLLCFCIMFIVFQAYFHYVFIYVDNLVPFAFAFFAFNFWSCILHSFMYCYSLTVFFNIVIQPKI